MKFQIIKVILISFLFISCNKSPRNNTLLSDSTYNNGIYKVLYGEREGFKVWIVDGPKIRREIFGEFLYGGNPERYTFNPEGEIWVDNSITSEELETTIIHEINERNLMHNKGMSYFDAHDSSLALEVILRNVFISKAKEHENSLSKVPPIDFDSTQEIENLPELIQLKDIYRQYIGNRNGIDIWIVDGVNIRRGIYPDFGFSGNDLAYLFIPEKEIWIDAQISCEELLFSIELELNERQELSKGIYYDDAYINALNFVTDLRNKKFNETKLQPSVKITQPLYRDKSRGTQ
jgi:hypothetical protein